MIPEPVAAAVAALRERLEQDGWTVELRTEPENELAGATLNHPLSSTMGLALSYTSHSLAFVNRYLEAREYRVIRSAPADLPHQSLLGSLRRMSAANQWTLHHVATLSLVLEHEGVLTPEEAEWLGWAGPAWWTKDDEARSAAVWSPQP